MMSYSYTYNKNIKYIKFRLCTHCTSINASSYHAHYRYNSSRPSRSRPRCASHVTRLFTCRKRAQAFPLCVCRAKARACWPGDSSPGWRDFPMSHTRKIQCITSKYIFNVINNRNSSIYASSGANFWVIYESWNYVDISLLYYMKSLLISLGRFYTNDETQGDAPLGADGEEVRGLPDVIGK